MSRVSFDFLSDSVLLDRAAQANLFSDLTDKELMEELAAYRGHVLDRLEELQNDVLSYRGRLGAYFGTSVCSEPKLRQLIRAGLYFDFLVIDDPLFRCGRKQTSDRETYMGFLGYERGPLNRQSVVDAARLVAELRPFVAGGVLKLVPASVQNEPSSKIALAYSQTLFAERVPAPLLPWFHGRAEVLPLRRDSRSGWESRPHDELTPCRGIEVRLRGFDEGMRFHLMTVRMEESERDGEKALQMIQWIPDEPPDANAFRQWVTQSINEMSGEVYREVAEDMRVAAGFGTMMFTDSELVSELLDVQIGENGGIREDLANLAMQFELPFLDDLTAEHLMTIRESEGEAFESYRLALQRQLRGLRRVDSEVELVQRLEEVQHEMAEVQVRHVRNEVARLKRELFRDAAIGLASLAAVTPSQGLSLATLLWAGEKVWKHSLKFAEIRRQPSHFVWRLLGRVEQ